MMPSWLSWDRVAIAAALWVLSIVLRRRLFRPRLRSFLGRRVLITGAGSGLGAALARLLNSSGAELVLCGRRRDRLQETAASLARPELPVHFCELDLARPEDLEGRIRELAGKLPGPVHLLINNAGQSYRGRVADTTFRVHEQLMKVNYLGHVALTTAWMKHLRPSSDISSAGVVFVSSVQGRLSIPFRSAYSAPKHALQAFADCLRAEEPTLRVLVASPGYINTNLSRAALRDSGEAHGQLDATTASGLAPETVAEEILAALDGGAAEVTLAPLSNSAAIWLRALWPRLYFALMARRAVKSCAY